MRGVRKRSERSLFVERTGESRAKTAEAGNGRHLTRTAKPIETGGAWPSGAKINIEV